MIAVCGLLAGIFILALRAKLDALAAMMAALAIFSISHFILRHPVVWFALVVGLILGSSRHPLPHARTGV